MKGISTKALGTEKISKLLVRLTIPTITAQIINLLYNMVDRIYIAHIEDVGSIALTGVGVTLPLIMIISASASLIAAGGAPRASISLGKNDHETANKILNNSFVSLFIISIILTIVFGLFQRDLLMMFGASENTIQYGLDYFSIYVLGIIFVLLTLGLNTFITAQGFTKISMLSVILGAGLNIILDPIFIFVLDLGVKGAAIATVLSQAVSCIWVLSFLKGSNSTLRLQRKYMKLDKNIMLPSITLGIAPFIMQSSESLLMLTFNSNLYKYGGDVAVGVMIILTSTLQLAMLPILGFAQGASPIISYNYGAKKIDRVVNTLKYTIIICLIYSMGFFIVCQSVPELFLNLFNLDEQYLEFGKSSLRMYMGGIFIIGALLSCQQAFIALGNAKSSMFIAILRKIILLIPMIYILPNFMENKTLGVFMAEPVSDILSALTTIILFMIFLRKIIRENKSV